RPASMPCQVPGVAVSRLPVPAVGTWILRVDLSTQRARLFRARIERQRAIHLASGGGEILERPVGFGERERTGYGLLAPERDLEGLHRLRGAAAAQVHAAEQQVGLGEIRREIERATQLLLGLPIRFPLEGTAPCLQVEPRLVFLIALPYRGNDRVDTTRRAIDGLLQTLEP